MSSPLLQIEDLHVNFQTEEGTVHALNGVSLDIESNQVMGLIGESGCGKSVTALSILQLLQTPPAKITKGRVLFDGEDLLARTDAEMDEIRGNRISMIYQDPMESLNPVLTIGQQVMEPLLAHRNVSKSEARERAVEMLDECGLADPERLIDEYPHSLSGGMRQRVMIAMGLITRPDLLIADEPTTALDVTTQAKILELMQSIQDEFDMTMLYISHNLAAVSELADRITIMYAGTITERCSLEALFERPRHPYTRKLTESIPRIGQTQERLPTIEGSVPSLDEPPSGCPFASRCPNYIGPVCDNRIPEPLMYASDHEVACHLYDSDVRSSPPWEEDDEKPY